MLDTIGYSAGENTQNDSQPLTPAEQWEFTRMARLGKEIKTPEFNHVSEATIGQLQEMVIKGKIVPMNARNLIVQRARILQQEGLPADVFKIRRSDLPVQSAPRELDYSPLDYLAASTPGATLFPLRAIQRMQYTRARKAKSDMDPLTMREQYRQGLLQIVTGMNRNSYDVKTLRGVSSPEDIIEIVESINLCAGDPMKEEMFIKVLTNQLQVKIDAYDKAVRQRTNNPEAQSNTSRELRELIEPENIRHLMRQITLTTKEWFATRKPDAEVLPLRPDLAHYDRMIKQNPYWFARVPGPELAARCKEFEQLATQNIDDQVVSRLTTDTARYIQGNRPTRYDPYLSRPFAEIAKEKVEIYLQDILQTTEGMYENALSGGSQVPIFSKLIDELGKAFVEFLEKAEKKKTELKKRAEKKEETGDVLDDEVAADTESANENSNVFYLSDLKKPEPVMVEDTGMERQLSWQLAKLTDLTNLVSKGVSPELMRRFHNIVRRIAESTIAEMVQNSIGPDSKVKTDDFYAIAKDYSKLYGLFRLMARIHDEETSRKLIDSIIEEKLGALSDDEFAGMYARMFENTCLNGRQTFSQFILPQQFRAPGYDMMISNRLPNARVRLVTLLTQRPELFHPNFVKMGQRQLEKDEAAKQKPEGDQN